MRTDCCYTKGFVTILFLKVSNVHVISISRYLYTKTSRRILNKLTSFFHCWNALWDKSKFKIFSFLWKKHKNGTFELFDERNCINKFYYRHEKTMIRQMAEYFMCGSWKFFNTKWLTIFKFRDAIGVHIELKETKTITFKVRRQKLGMWDTCTCTSLSCLKQGGRGSSGKTEIGRCEALLSISNLLQLYLRTCLG